MLTNVTHVKDGQAFIAALALVLVMLACGQVLAAALPVLAAVLIGVVVLVRFGGWTPARWSPC